MRFGVLGPLQVWSDDGNAVPVGGPRPRALLAVLLLDAGRVVGVERLVAAQYGDEPPPGAANALQTQVSRLRRSLPPGLVEYAGGGYRLAVEPGDVDVHRFARLTVDGRALLAAGRPADAAAALREALALWRGPALPDLPDGRDEVARLDELRLTAVEDLVDADPGGTSVADLQRLVAAHPLRERLRGQLMRALAAAGRPAEALVTYEDARRLLAEELGADPSPELAATYLAILRAEQPARRPPTALTSFVGRTRELEWLAAHRDARLVTVLGPGGVGKTRLAFEAVAPGGPLGGREVCVVDLSPVADQVAPAVLGALGVREAAFGGNLDPVGRLVAALDRELLLVLDNCEHVVDAVAALVRTLLAECPGVAVLATSREPLGLTGETLLPLAPLGTDDAAVRLFADRAAAVRPGFVVGPANRAAVAEVCAALDGLPLAIELAAARLRQFTVGEIAARLSTHDHFALLNRGDRTASARHRTLRATVEWSWDLLRPDERELARRFAVFAGGATLDAVVAVCDADENVLADLVDRSFVDVVDGRYRMLETIRLFCAEAGVPHRAHAGYFLTLAREADPHLRRAEQLDWLARLAADHDNLMAALRWAVGADRETAMRLVAALAAYWWLSGRRGEVGELAAALVDGDVPDGLEEEWVSCVVHAVPRPPAAHWERAKAVMRTPRELRHPFGAAVYGMTAGPPIEGADGPGPLAGDDPWNTALDLLGRALLDLLDGRPSDGERRLADVLGRFRAFGERWGTAQALDWLALLASWRGEWSRADAGWSEALALLDALGAGQESADVLCHRAECRIRRGDLDGAAVDYRLAAELSRRAGRPGPPEVALGLGRVARLRGDATTAARHLDGAGNGPRARVERARLGGARVLFDESGAAARGPHQASDLAEVAVGRAEGAVLGGDAEGGALLLGAAVALRGMAVTGDPDVARTAAAIPAEVLAEAYARGAAMTREEALTALSADRR
jgi:predicted ATPase/DNA-binding SARP family transcriptional activator